MIKINDIKTIKNLSKAINELTDTVRIELDNEGVRFRMLDRSHICFIGLEASPYWFSEYKLNEPLAVLLDTGDLKNILSRGKNDDLLRVSLVDDKVLFCFMGEANRKFTAPLIDQEYDTPNMPIIDYPVKVELLINDLLESFNDVKLFSDKCKLSTNNDKLLITTDDAINGSYEGTITLLTHADLHVSSLYSLGYLEYLKSLNTINDTVQVSIGDDMPLHVELTSESDDLKVTYLLAPRLESEY